MAAHSPKRIYFDDRARRGVAGGIEMAGRLAGAVYGPHGGMALLERTDDFPEVTKSGFTAVRDMTPLDPLDRIGIELVKEGATKVHYDSGDGASATCLVMQALSRAVTRLAAAGIEAPTIARGFSAARSVALDALRDVSLPAPDAELLASLVARVGDDDAELATIVAEAVDRVGSEGMIKVSYSQGITTEVDYAMGASFDHGALSRDFFERGKTEIRLESPLLLLSEDKLETATDVIPALEIAKAQGRPLLVLAEDVSGQANATLLANHRGNVVRCATVKGPGSGMYRRQMTADLALLSDGQMFGSRVGRSPATAKAEDLGGVDLALVDARSTRLFGGDGQANDVEARIRQLRDARRSETSTYDRGKIEQRIARLVAGVANIRVGAFTEAEWKERHRRAEAMVACARSAVREGVVAGGGVALYRAAEAVKLAFPDGIVEQAYAVALDEPLKLIASRAGCVPSKVQSDLAKAGPAAGFDAQTGRVVDDARTGQLLDPLAVVIAVLTNASSIAEQLARVGCVIVASPPRQALAGKRRK